jgi:hypothetical protein
VTVERGPNERREPIFLKERTEREGKHEGGGGGDPTRTHTHDEGERGGGKRDRGSMGGTWGGVKEHMC